MRIGLVDYGYLTRGCPRQCPFCIVADKEGTASVAVAGLRRSRFYARFRRTAFDG